VYWTRRLILVAVALLLLVTIARVLGGGSDGKGSGGSSKALQAAADVSNADKGASDNATDDGSTAAAVPTTGKGGPKAPLASPSGPCVADDVTVTPVIRKAAGGQDVPLGLALTSTVPACTFEVSSKSVVLKIISGSDNIWSSQQCPASIPTQDVIVRSAVPAKVVVQWDGRRSDEDCSRAAGWATPGYYHAISAALGGEPADVQFQLTRPPAVFVTVTPKPKPSTASPTASPTGGSTASTTGSPSGRPTSGPSTP
jgi:hypothetical protein